MAVVSGPPSGKEGTIRAVIFWIGLILVGLGIWWFSSNRAAAQAWTLPPGPLHYGDFQARFAADGAFALEGQGWPAFKGTWRRDGSAIEIVTPGAPDGCDKAGRYAVAIDGRHVTLEVVSDACAPRRMILDHSAWLPLGEREVVPERTLVRTAPSTAAALPAAAPAAGSWPSFRGAHAAGIADGQHLPDRWDAKTAANILWRTPIPGLAHSSPVVWGDRVFVTSAISSRPDASFKPGLYGDGDASDDRSKQRWTIFAIDKRSGTIV